MFRWILALSLLATPAHAAGLVSLTWDGCVGPLGKTIPPGSIADLYLSVTGQTELHRAYDVRIWYGTDCPIGSALHDPYGGSVPDAWRFDDAGCQQSLGAISNLPVALASKTCPAFQQLSTPSFQIRNFTFDPGVQAGVAVLLNSYPNGVATVDPNKRYCLALFRFDQTNGVAGPGNPGCGGLQEPMCFVIKGTPLYLTPDGVEHVWAVENFCVVANDGTNSNGCPGATPARATTWGTLKGRYR